MKNIQKLFYIILLALMVGAYSCKKLNDFGDTNVNPNATTSAPSSALLTNVESGIGGYAFQTTPGYFCQYFSQTQYTTESNYSTPQADFSGTYAGSLEDLQNIIDNSGINNMAQVAHILKAYIFWTITDRWGPVPYTEALKGKTTPVYDDQEIIYKGIIQELKDAVAGFDANSAISGDVIFSGSVASWKKAANSIRLLAAVRLAKVYPGSSDYAATVVKEALSADGGVITTNAQNFKISYPSSSAAFKNPIWSGYDGRKDNGEAKTMTDQLAKLNDGRQDAFGGLSELGASVDPNWNVTSNIGFPYGLTQGDASLFTGSNAGWARVLRGDLRTVSSPMFLVTASQVYLARAEAADLGWIAEDVTADYKNGVIASFQQWGLTAPADSYFAQADVALTKPAGTGANIKPIAIQRYIAYYPDGLQGWSVWRETGYPVLTPSVNATNSTKQIPRRYTYGTGEYGSNNANTLAAAAKITGGDTQDSKVWWDK